MKKRIVCLLAVLALVCAAFPAFAMDGFAMDKPRWAPQGEVEISFRNLTGDQYSSAENVMSSILRASWEDHLLYADFEDMKQAEKSEAEVIRCNKQGTEFTVLFHKPGRYQVCGVDIYIFDPDNAQLAALAVEINDAVNECRGPNEKETARRLKSWIVSRIKYGDDRSEYPERNQYDDPIAVLIRKEGICTGYSNLYRLMAETAGLKVFSQDVTIKKDGAGHKLNLNRLDGEWSFTDVTWSKGNGDHYFAMSEEELNRYAEVPSYSEDYYRWFSSPEQIRELNGIIDY